jgi:ribokinase
MSIVVFGSLNADTTLDVARQPAWGETILAAGSSTAAGGKGANQAVAARRLGAEVLMVGRVGRDSAGDFLRSSLAADGVGSGLTIDPEQPTGSAFILRGPGGRNSIVVAPGANAAVTVADLASVRCELPAVLVLQLEVPLAVSKAAVLLGRSRGWHVLLNPAPAAPVDEATLAAVDTLVANEHEATQLTGIKVTGVDSARSAAERLIEAGCRTVAVTLGDQGAVLLSHREAWFAPAPEVQAIDTTAAGDAFVGALAVSILQGLEPPDALRLAVATGSLAVTRKGAQPSLPARSEAVALAATVSVMEIASAQNSGHHATAQTIQVNSGVGGDGSHQGDAVTR